MLVAHDLSLNQFSPLRCRGVGSRSAPGADTRPVLPVETFSVECVCAHA